MKKDKLPKVISPYALAKQQAEIAGELEIKQLERLMPIILGSHGPVTVDLQFGCDEQHYSWIKGRVAAEVELACERCGQAVAIDLVAHPELGLVQSDAQAAKLPSYYEPIMVDENKTLELIGLVEEELLLALPMFAKHAEGECPKTE